MKQLFSGFRERLLLLVMLAVIPALALVVYTGLEQRQINTAEAQQTALRIAQEVSHNQNHLFANAQQLLSVLAQLPELKNYDSKACNQHFSDILNQLRDAYIQITAFKANGDLFCSAPFTATAFNISDRKHYLQAMTTREVAMGNYVVSRLLETPSVFLAQPVLDQDGAVTALVNVGMNLDWLAQMIEAENLPQGYVLTVFNSAGITLARHPEPAKWLGHSLPEQAILTTLRQTPRAGTARLDGPDGVTRLYGYVPLSVQDTDAFVAVGVPVSIAQAPANQALFRNLLLLCAVTLLAIMAAWFGSKYFVLRQLDKLMGATHRLSGGDLNARAALSGGVEELRALGLSFDAMAATLQEKERERTDAARSLQASEQQLQNVLAVTGEGIWDWDQVSDVVHHNGRWCELLGYGREMMEHPVSAFIDRLHEDDREVVMARIRACLEGNGHYQSEHRMRQANGQVISVYDRGDVIERNAKGEPMRMIGAFADITERKMAEEKSLQAATALDVAHDGIYMFWPDSLRFFYVNKGAMQQTGYSADELLSMTPLDIKPEINEADFRAMLAPLLKHEQDIHAYETIHRRKDGQDIPVEIVMQCASLDAGQQSLVTVVRDISEKKQKDNIIWQQANYDTLTGLPNRRLLNDRLDQEIKKAHRSELPFAVLFIDLDRFKEINDTLGHAKGDLLLREAAHRLSMCVRESDTLARLGGDEFTAILTNVSGRAQIERIAQHIIEELSKPYYFENDNNGYYISASIGITLYPDDAQDIGSLLKHADQAMYQAKTEGRKRYSYFTKSMQQEARGKIALTHDLRQALAQQQLHVYYQPIVELTRGRIVKAEALLRWKHPDRGMVSPSDFIPLAEETGLIHDIGAWVIEQVIAKIVSWRDQFGRIIPISVNKSPVQFEYTSKKVTWPEELASLGLPGRCITVEITEGLLLKDSPKTKQRLVEFRNNGIEVSIDDFGTGFSALSYLKQFDIDYLKIDRAFTSKLTEDESDKVLTEAIIVMAHKLGIQTIAEGVETTAQRDILASFGCDYAQGFLYSPAVPAEAFERLLLNYQDIA